MSLSSRPTRHFWVFPGFTRVRSVSFVSASCPSASVQPLLFSQRFLGLSLPTEGGLVFTLSFIFMMHGLGEGASYPVALDHSTRVKTDLIRSGFVPYLEEICLGSYISP